MRIYEVVTSWNGPLVIAGEFERTVHVFHLDSGKHNATFDTIFEFGGERIAITQDGRLCIAAAYNRFGIAAYDVRDGREVWRRKDLKGIQVVRISPDDRQVFCCDDKPCQLLSRMTGKTSNSLRGVHDIWDSPYAPIRLLGKEALELVTRRGKILAKIPRITFAVLGVAFGPRHVCITESGGPVRCIDLSTRNLLWTHKPVRGVHFLDVVYAEGPGAFAGVSWLFERGGQKMLHRFEPESGTPNLIAELAKPIKTAFCKKGSRLVTTDGEIFDVANGRRIRSLAFPRE
jgi:hypothetical protein